MSRPNFFFDKLLKFHTFVSNLNYESDLKIQEIFYKHFIMKNIFILLHIFVRKKETKNKKW